MSKMQRIEAEKEFTEAMANFERDKMIKELELEKQRKEIMNTESLQQYKEQERKYLEGKLAKYLTRITEVNLIGKELKRNVNFSPHQAYFFTEYHNFQAQNDDHKKLKIKVLVENHEVGYSYVWDLSKFSNRYFMIKDLLERYFENNEIPFPQENDDPFWDPMEPQLIGQGFLKLMSLAYLLDNPTEQVLVGDNGQAGVLNVDLIPCTEEGEEIDPETLMDEELVEDPSCAIY